MEAGKWLQGADGRTERPLRLAAAKEFLAAQSRLGAAAEEGSAKGYYRSVLDKLCSMCALQGHVCTEDTA